MKEEAKSNTRGEYKSYMNGAATDLVAQFLKNISGIQDQVVHKALVETSDDLVITIPKTMDKLTASKELERQWQEEEVEITVGRAFGDWKWQDTLVAIHITAEEYFGWIDVKQSLFNPPTEIQIITDYKDGLPEKRTCFYGQLKVEALEGATCTITPDYGGVNVGFKIKKKYKKRVEDWFELIDKRLRAHSIYRSKSVSVTGGDDFGGAVGFEIIETKSNPKIVLNPKEKSVVEQYCALDFKEKGKRTYLFTGPYGNGKTEAAMMLGDKAKSLGMTFFYVKRSDAFTHLLEIAAKNYTPCLIFMEDIDEVGSGEERTQQINSLLNTLDGAATKNKDIKVLFTTNHHQAINQALRRPGRLDLIVRFENPDAETREEIFRRHFRDLRVPGIQDLDFGIISGATPDCSGAFVAEICKRSIRLAELNGCITNEICIAAINTIKDHLQLMSDPVEQGDKIKGALQIIGELLLSSVLPKNIATEGDVIKEGNSVRKAIYGVGYDLSQKVVTASEMSIERDEKMLTGIGEIKNKLKVKSQTELPPYLNESA